jgi:hypothetical protein
VPARHSRDSPAGRTYHFVYLRCKAGWLTRPCPTTAWKASDRGDAGVPIVATHDPEYFCRARLGQIDRVDDVSADLALGIAALASLPPTPIKKTSSMELGGHQRQCEPSDP